MRVELRLNGGAQYSGILSVSNDSQERHRIRAEVLDFYIDQTATPQFSPQYAQEAAFSCRDWIAVNPMEWEQDAGIITPVRFTVRAPQGAAERGYHCALGFTALPPASKGPGIGLRTTVRAVSAIYVAVGNAAVQGALRSVSLENIPAPRQALWQAVVTVENLGWSVFRPTGELQVVGEDGGVLESYPLVSLPVLPQRQQRYPIPLGRVSIGGRYTLRARVDIGSGEIQEGTAVVVARPAASQ